VIRIVVAMIVAAVAGVSVAAPPREMEVSPAAPGGPLLRLSLAEPEGGARSGDAAPLYYQAALGLALSGEDLRTLTEFIEDRGPARRPDLVRAVVDRSEGSLELLGLASGMASCTWGTPVGALGGSVRVPEVGRLRQLGMLLSARARLELLRGDTESCVRTIGQGMRMARQIGAGPTIVQGIVGLSLGDAMCDELERVVTSENGSSVYWALTSLGETPVDLRPALAGERQIMQRGRVRLEDVAAGRARPAEALADLRPLVYGGQESPGTQVRWAGIAASTYARARAAMVAGGRSESEVAALPVSYVSLWFRARRYVELRDEVFAWAGLPFAQGREGLEAAQERVSRAVRDDPDELVTSLPDLVVLRQRWVSLEQRWALLRAVEAVRAYAGVHAGEVPSGLGTPGVPPTGPDPLTGRAMGYRVIGGGVVEVTSGEGNESVTWRVRMRGARER
jgi:hypothetical protein